MVGDGVETVIGFALDLDLRARYATPAIRTMATPATTAADIIGAVDAGAGPRVSESLEADAYPFIDTTAEGSDVADSVYFWPLMSADDEIVDVPDMVFEYVVVLVEES